MIVESVASHIKLKCVFLLHHGNKYSIVIWLPNRIERNEGWVAGIELQSHAGIRRYRYPNHQMRPAEKKTRKEAYTLI